jgi:2',3'-cyclic-nucleotide 2'-phosphodiesterase (5'-nucleotidase family)
VIGLSTIETPATTATFNDGTFPAYKFLEYAPIVQERSSRLRQAGANAVVIVSHVGNNCDADNTFGVWLESTPQKSNCTASDEIGQLLKALPTGTIDGVVQGHRHRFSHHFI